MIIFIIVPPGDQLFAQRTLHNLFGDMLPRLICVVPEEEEIAWRQLRPWLELLTYDEYNLRVIRAMIQCEFEDEDIHVIARHDLALSRRLPHINRLSQCSKMDIQVLISWFNAQVCNHGSISEHRRNKSTLEKGKLVAAPSLLNFYRPAAVDFEFIAAPETLIDQDLTLSLLRTGNENVVNYEFACRSVSEIVVDREDAFELEKRHPGLVEAVEVKPGTWNVTCQWRQAYDASC